MGVALLLVLVAGPLGLEGIQHDSYHRDSSAPDDCPLCLTAKTLATDDVPDAPALGDNLDSFATPLPTTTPRPQPAPATRRGRAPPSLS
jgi:hypothetical protein